MIKIKKNRAWKNIGNKLDPTKNIKIINKHVNRATALNAKIVETEIRNGIKQGGFAANAPLTVAMKGENKPLVGLDSGAQLFQAITTSNLDDNSVFVGVLKRDDFYDIARTIHDGVTISVTPAMRALFMSLWLASMGEISPDELSTRGKELYDHMSDGWKPLRKDTKSITIPARPFINKAIENDKVKQISSKNWNMSLKAAFKEINS